MNKILSYKGNEVYVGHFQGNTMKNFIDIVEEYSTKRISISPRVSVITAFTDKTKAITAYQLEISTMPYVNACPEGKENWTNIDKIKCYVEALEKTTSEYSLLVDGYDVLFFRNIDEDFIKAFEGMEKKILFNATKNRYPNIRLEQEREDLGEYKYLNAGVAFGKTEALLAFYKEVLKTTERKDIINPWNSEQLYVRMVAEDKEEVGIDHNCLLFQTFSKTTKAICGDTVIIV